MRIQVYEGPDGTTVSVSDVPVDFSDADVQYSVEQCAAEGDVVAQQALHLCAKHNPCWININNGHDRATVRAYVDS